MRDPKFPYLQREFFCAAQIDKVAISTVATVFIPVLFHLFGGYSVVPIGAVWIPIFYAPFVAVIFFRFHVSILAAILAPLLNTFFIGRPMQSVAAVLVVELIFFVIFSKIIYRIWNNFLGISVVAYLISKIISSNVLGMIPYFSFSQSGLTYFVTSIKVSFPGLMMLLLINIFSLRIKHLGYR